MVEFDLLHRLDQKQIYIFDFDGVLVDSVDIKTKAFAELYKGYGNHIVDKVVRHHKDNGGMSRFDKFIYYHQNFLGVSLNDGMLSKLSEEFSDLVVSKVISSNEISGAINFVLQCKKRNKICAINSATPESELKKIIQLKGWNEYFQFICGSPVSKEVNIRNILIKSGVAQKDAVFFGDAENDYKAAKLSQVDFIGINYLSTSKKDFICYDDFTSLVV